MTAQSAKERMQRLLVILPWLVGRGSATFDELTERFGGSRADLVRDLEGAATCGLPPYQPGELFDILVDDDEVSVWKLDSYQRPPRLTSHEAVALLTAGATLLKLPGSQSDGALASALSKINEALGGRRVEVDLDTPECFEVMRDAIASHRVVKLSYASASSDDVTERFIEPVALSTNSGSWYVSAWCRRAGDYRQFRLDRVREAELTEEVVPPSESHLSPPESLLDGELASAVIEIRSEMRWMVDSLPGTVLTAVGGDRLRVEVKVTTAEWLAILLLRLGPSARLVAPEQWLDLGAQAATELLRTYRR
jgi:proteasome accessory factor C